MNDPGSSEVKGALAATRAAAYLIGRQSPNGGFCFYRAPYLDEPNLADTYCAVRGLLLLERAIPHKHRLIRFLRRFEGFDQPNQLYYRAMGLLSLAPAREPAAGLLDGIDALRILAPPAAESPALSGWLARARTIARLKHRFERFAEAGTVHPLVLGVSQDGGYGDRPNLWDTWLALDILRCCGDTSSLQASLAFIDRLQIGPFGFTAIEGSVYSNLDVIFAGVRCCALLGTPVKFPLAALSFVLACQSGRGGFARSPDALPDIELTYRALWTLSRLKCIGNDGRAASDPARAGG